MRIVFVTNNYTPFSGGVVSSIKTTTTELQNQGHEVFIITLDFLGSSQLPEENVFRVPSLLRFRYKANRLAISRRPDAHVKKIIHDLKPDIIHSNHPWILGSSALKAARALHIPIVFTFHTLYEAYTHYVPLPPRFTRWITRVLARRYCNAVDAVIAPSEPIKEYIRLLGVTTPIWVIPSGISPMYIKEFKEKAAHNGSFKLLCVGRLVAEKSVALLFDVMEILNNKSAGRYQLTIIGYGADEALLESMVAQRNLDQTIKFVIKPDKEAIALAYQDADLFLFPSSTDTQALVLAEAMAASTPVIALQGPGQHSIIEQGVNGFIVDSPRAMADCIEKITSDKQLFQNMQKAAWETSARYRPEHTVKELIRCYQSVLIS